MLCLYVHMFFPSVSDVFCTAASAHLVDGRADDLHRSVEAFQLRIGLV